MAGERVLLIGLHASAVDFAKWPALTAASLTAAFDEVTSGLAAAGFEPRWCLLRDAGAAEAEVRDALSAFRPDIISIGAGVRTDADLLLLFERLVNVCHAGAPGARFAFNVSPLDTVAAVGRQTRA